MGWRCALRLFLGFHELSSSEESDLAIVVSAAGHVPFSPVADTCYAGYQLQSTIQFPSLQGSLETLAVVTPHNSILPSIPLPDVGMRNH